MTSIYHPLFDPALGDNPARRNGQARIDFSTAASFAAYLSCPSHFWNDEQIPIDYRLWYDVLEDGGTLETLTMADDVFIHTIGALIPADVISALCDIAGITLLQAGKLSLRKLIIMAEQEVDRNWSKELYDAVNTMVGCASRVDATRVESVPEETGTLEGDAIEKFVDDTPQLSDGPSASGFHFSGRSIEQLTPAQLSIMKALWNVKGWTLDLFGIAEAIKGDSAAKVTERSVACHASRITKELEKADIMLRVTFNREPAWQLKLEKISESQ